MEIFFQSKGICDVVQICMIYTIYTVSVHNLNDYYFLAPLTLLIKLANSSTLKYYDSTKNWTGWLL